MNDFDTYIISWLKKLPTDIPYSTHVKPPCKKRPCDAGPPSPPPSHHNTGWMHPSTPQNKKRRLESVPSLPAPPDNHVDEDPNEETPRQEGPYSISETDDSSSHTSNRSSPSKTFSKLSLNPDGLEEKQLDFLDSRLPDSLVQLATDMEEIGMGDRVIPDYLETELTELQKSSKAHGLFRPRMFDKSPEQPKRFLPHLHHKLQLDAIIQLLGDAKDCNDMEDDEAGWNNLVHTPLLKAAFYGNTPRGRQLDGFRPCTSASILPAYRIKGSSGKKVDYVFHFDPEKDSCQPETVDAINTWRAALTDNSINHTPYAPLRRFPISVSIETKPGGMSTRKAQLQMGVWHAAQWRHLYKLAGANLQALPFIPAILVYGHDWVFVASTYENGKTTLWTGGTFGSTLRLLSTFQVIAGIQRLRTWAMEVFWPWYKTYVLRVTTPVSAPT
ncbi:hypothetical protein FOCG_16714 [Fusarium oxysporum f. sp. radicis-lycopersici 26381]|nr:hypothetical protein FOCG_16714 [Fusarium oxysporum f. sp. radicis-lycopersici 26381]